MQDDTPQAEPRLCPVKSGAKTTTGFMDPCIVYLKVSPPGKLPLLAVCWAASSREINEPGKSPYWELRDVIIIQNQAGPRPGRKHLWTFSTLRKATVYLIPDAKDYRTAKCSYLSGSFEDSPDIALRWSMRHLDRSTDAALRKFLQCQSKNSAPLAKALLQCAKVQWNCIKEALASFEKKKSKKLPLGKFVRHLVASVLKPVAA